MGQELWLGFESIWNEASAPSSFSITRVKTELSLKTPRILEIKFLVTYQVLTICSESFPSLSPSSHSGAFLNLVDMIKIWEFRRQRRRRRRRGRRVSWMVKWERSKPRMLWSSSRAVSTRCFEMTTKSGHSPSKIYVFVRYSYQINPEPVSLAMKWPFNRFILSLRREVGGMSDRF